MALLLLLLLFVRLLFEGVVFGWVGKQCWVGRERGGCCWLEFVQERAQ